MDWVQEPSPVECVTDEEINIRKRTKLTYMERSMNERNVEKTLRMQLNSRAEWVYMMKQVQHAMTAPSTWVNQEPVPESKFDLDAMYMIESCDKEKRIYYRFRQRFLAPKSKVYIESRIRRLLESHTKHSLVIEASRNSEYEGKMVKNTHTL
ncbi:hypothetical protein Tco_1187240 [Tanacetum coccineum]